MESQKSQQQLYKYLMMRNAEYEQALQGFGITLKQERHILTRIQSGNQKIYRLLTANPHLVVPKGKKIFKKTPRGQYLKSLYYQNLENDQHKHKLKALKKLARVAKIYLWRQANKSNLLDKLADAANLYNKSNLLNRLAGIAHIYVQRCKHRILLKKADITNQALQLVYRWRGQFDQRRSDMAVASSLQYKKRTLKPQFKPNVNQNPQYVITEWGWEYRGVFYCLNDKITKHTIKDNDLRKIRGLQPRLDIDPTQMQIGCVQTLSYNRKRLLANAIVRIASEVIKSNAPFAVYNLLQVKLLMDLHFKANFGFLNDINFKFEDYCPPQIQCPTIPPGRNQKVMQCYARFMREKLQWFEDFIPKVMKCRRLIGTAILIKMYLCNPYIFEDQEDCWVTYGINKCLFSTDMIQRICAQQPT